MNDNQGQPEEKKENGGKKEANPPRQPKFRL
jgi:hypothetical protein